MPDGDQQNYEDASFSAMCDLNFNRFITLSVIKVLYVLGLILIGLGWLMMVATTFSQGGATAGIFGLIFFTVGALLYAIFLRVGLELIVVIFRIGENTSKLVEGQGQTPAGGSDLGGGE